MTTKRILIAMLYGAIVDQQEKSVLTGSSCRKGHLRPAFGR